jgi:hypothetical protein
MAAKKSKKKAKTVKKAKATTKKAVKKAKKTVKKAVKKAAAKKAGASARSVATAYRQATKKKKAPARKKKQIVGEGDYAATRAFDSDQTAFVKKNKAKIPALGKAAEAALDGPEGDELRAAEAAAAGRSRDTFEP